MIDHETARRLRRLSELARRVLRAAESWAGHSAPALPQRVPHSGHILLALVLETRSFSSGLLREAGVDLAHARAFIAAHPFQDEDSFLALIDSAFAHAARLGSHYTGTEHLLLALTTDADALACFLDAGIDVTRLRERVESVLAR